MANWSPLQSLIFGVAVSDPLTFALMGLGLLAVAVAARPSRPRATRVDTPLAPSAE